MIDPSEQFVSIVRQWDEIFKQKHGYELSWEEGILDDLRDAVEEHSPQFPPKLIERYSKFRIFTREGKMGCEVSYVELAPKHVSPVQ